MKKSLVLSLSVLAFVFYAFTIVSATDLIVSAGGHHNLIIRLIDADKDLVFDTVYATTNPYGNATVNFSTSRSKIKILILERNAGETVNTYESDEKFSTYSDIYIDMRTPPPEIEKITPEINETEELKEKLNTTNITEENKEIKSNKSQGKFTGFAVQIKEGFNNLGDNKKYIYYSILAVFLGIIIFIVSKKAKFHKKSSENIVSTNKEVKKKTILEEIEEAENQIKEAEEKIDRLKNTAIKREEQKLNKLKSIGLTRKKESEEGIEQSKKEDSKEANKEKESETKNKPDKEKSFYKPI